MKMLHKSASHLRHCGDDLNHLVFVGKNECLYCSGSAYDDSLSDNTTVEKMVRVLTVAWHNSRIALTRRRTVLGKSIDNSVFLEFFARFLDEGI